MSLIKLLYDCTIIAFETALLIKLADSFATKKEKIIKPASGIGAISFNTRSKLYDHLKEMENIGLLVSTFKNSTKYYRINEIYLKSIQSKISLTLEGLEIKNKQMQ